MGKQDWLSSDVAGVWGRVSLEPGLWPWGSAGSRSAPEVPHPRPVTQLGDRLQKRRGTAQGRWEGRPQRLPGCLETGAYQRPSGEGARPERPRAPCPDSGPCAPDAPAPCLHAPREDSRKA